MPWFLVFSCFNYYVPLYSHNNTGVCTSLLSAASSPVAQYDCPRFRHLQHFHHELKTQSQQATHAMDPRPEGILPDVLSFPRTLSINFQRKRQGRTRVTRRAPQNLEVRLTTSLQIYYMRRFSVLGCFMTRRMHGILSYISVNP